MKFTIINGPNLNLLGTREPDVYGSVSFEEYFSELQNGFPSVEINYFQSNSEGDIITFLQKNTELADGFLINPGGLTHTSVALRDCISAIKVPVLEIHISNINTRDEFRQISLTEEVCIGSITGLGLDSYKLGLEHFIHILKHIND